MERLVGQAIHHVSDPEMVAIRRMDKIIRENGPATKYGPYPEQATYRID